MSEILSAKNNCRIDLTPMVDLGFLLITFFIFTTSLQTPVAIRLILPDDRPTEMPTEVAASKTLTLVLDESSFGFYRGNNIHNMTVSSHTVVEVRTAVMNHLASVEKKFGIKKEAIILLKPTNECRYKQLIGGLDEMTINDVKKFMLLEATKQETDMLLNKM